MDKLTALSFILMLAFGYIAYLWNYPVLRSISKMNTVPYCFGRDLCEDFHENQLVMEYKNFADFFYNMFSVKNVYFANYEGVSVVVKQWEPSLNEHKNDNIVSTDNLVLSDFKFCSNRTYDMVLSEFRRYGVNEDNFLSRFNAELVTLMLFPSGNLWRVPYLYGCCRHLFVEEHCGKPLTDLHEASWFDRAYIAKQLLEAAFNFTLDHEKYRLYLTDISSDNIVVGNNFRVTFIDLENALLAENYHDGTIHKSHDFPEEDAYIFSELDICSSAISDHNIYSVCKLLLSEEAPWPMMKNGLLHSPPRNIRDNYTTLFVKVELCVSGNLSDRFDVGANIIHTLTEILITSVHN